ncbi:putative Beta-flanking protein [Seiridium cardinale]
MSFFGRDNDDDRRGGREDYPSGGNATHGGSYPAGGYGQDDDDLRGAAEHASRHAGSSGDSSMFSGLLGALGEKKGRLAEEDVDEDDAVRQHQRFFGSGGDSNEADDRSMGSAAAMQALKMFSGGSSGNSQSNSSQSAFVGLAMGEASKLFDQKANQGQVSSGASKESAVMQAGEMALKFYMKSQGGSSSSSGLMGLASKFL